MSILPFPSKRTLPGISASPRVKALDEIQSILDRRSSSSLPLITAHCSLGTSPPPLTHDQICTRGYRALKKLTGFIGHSQLATVKTCLRGEEGEWFMEKMEALAAIVEKMPKTYETDGQGDDAICYLHYFGGSYDGYLIEKDMEESEDPAEAQWQAHGFVHWAHMPESAECGYICLPEIFKSRIVLDFHFEPTPVREIKRKHGLIVEEAAAEDVSELQTADHEAAAEFDADDNEPPAPKSTGIFGAWELLSEQIPHGAILFCKMGDFYETFAHHAKLAAPLLQVALTKRKLVPMCGFPVHAADSYIKSLTDAGHAVMLATFDAATGKATVQRTITPAHDDGIVTDEDLAATTAILQQDYLTAEKQSPGSGWRVGAVMVETWGYEQTNKDFYQIVERKGDWLTLVPLTAIQTRHKDSTGTDAMRGTSIPGPSKQEVKPIRRKIRHGSYGPIAKGEHGYLDLWKGTPESWTDYA